MATPLSTVDFTPTFGGGVAPIITGTVAQRYGIENILWVAMSGVLPGVVVAVFLRETAPRKVGASGASSTAPAA